MANQDELAKGPSGNSFGYKWSTRMRGWILVSWFSQLAGYLPSRDSLAISGRDIVEPGAKTKMQSNGMCRVWVSVARSSKSALAALYMTLTRAHACLRSRGQAAICASI